MVHHKFNQKPVSELDPPTIEYIASQPGRACLSYHFHRIGYTSLWFSHFLYFSCLLTSYRTRYLDCPCLSIRCMHPRPRTSSSNSAPPYEGSELILFSLLLQLYWCLSEWKLSYSKLYYSLH